MTLRRNITRWTAGAAIAAFVIGSVGVGLFGKMSTWNFPQEGGMGSPVPLFPAVPPEDTFPWDRQQDEGREFFRQFQKAVAANERVRVADMMMYPLRVNHFTDERAAEYRFIDRPEQLLSQYEKVFHPSVIEYISAFDAEKVVGNDYFLSTDYGLIGIYCTTTGACPDCSFDFKVKIIRSHSIYRDSIEDILGRPLKK